VIDLDKNPDKELVERFEAASRKHSAVDLPYLVVRYPAAQQIAQELWAGTLREAPLRALLESPARAELSKRILSGESAVWVLVECGDRAKDDAAFDLLARQLRKLESSLKLPEPRPEDLLRLQRPNAPPLKLSFSALRLSRNDPSEKWFVEMLLGTEADLKIRGEPIVFPVFGRGVALYALVGKGINETTIAQAAGFVTGECSCEVRRLNPGCDLLINAAWETNQELPSVANLLFMPAETAGGVAGSVRAAALATAGASQTPAATGPVLWCPSRETPSEFDALWAGLGGLGAGLLVIFAVGFWIIGRGKGPL